MASTLMEKAVVGRRVEFTYFRTLPDGPAHPGIITGTEPGLSGSLLALIRLDGKRSTLRIPLDYQGLTYLDEVVPVPDLPMGPFTPVADDKNAIYQLDGVLWAQVGEDGEYLFVVTDDLEAAQKVARAHVKKMRMGTADVGPLTSQMSVFEWEPEDAECPWIVRAAAEGEPAAVHTYYLYA